MRFAAPLAGALLLAAFIAPVSPAAAESGVPCVGITRCTDTFNVSGEPEFWTVPNGVGRVELAVAAGSGGDSSEGGLGGAGGLVKAEVEVETGDRLALIVGDRGTDWDFPTRMDSFGGGAAGDVGHSGSGGGGSFVFIESDGAWEPLLIAGGGGGASHTGNGAGGGFSEGEADAPNTPNSAGSASGSGSGYPDGNMPVSPVESSRRATGDP